MEEHSALYYRGLGSAVAERLCRFFPAGMQMIAAEHGPVSVEKITSGRSNRLRNWIETHRPPFASVSSGAFECRAGGPIMLRYRLVEAP